MHGGTVTATSLGENQGAVFTVQLPVIEQIVPTTSSERVLSSKDIENPLSNLQILVVDDDKDTREFQAFVLEQSGAKVVAVSSGLEALQVLNRFIPDVLVSDVGMAEMDGYMLIQQIRSREALRSNSRLPERGGKIPALAKLLCRRLALTAYAAEIDQQRALQVGFQAHLTKPVEPEQLIEAIVSLLGSQT